MEGNNKIEHLIQKIFTSKEWEEYVNNSEIDEKYCNKYVTIANYEIAYPTKYLLQYPESLFDWAKNNDFELFETPPLTNRTRKSVIDWMKNTPQITAKLILETGW